jgi:uncharacterized protein (TIGR02284 family)
MKSEENRKTIEVLNDVLKINADRVVGYTLALRESKDADLKIMFRNVAEESKNNIRELSRLILQLGGDPEFGENTMAGKIYHVWMELKTTFTGENRLALLDSCAFGEEAAAKAFHRALDEENISGEAIDLLYRQSKLQQASYTVIQAYRKIGSNSRDRTTMMYSSF